jgi:hypothetical protein
MGCRSRTGDAHKTAASLHDLLDAVLHVTEQLP